MSESGDVAPPPAEAPVAVSWVNPANALTGLRMLLVPLLAWLLLRDGGEDTASRVAAFVVFAVGMVTDRLDGELARRRGLVTTLGTVADPIADKVFIGTAFVGLSLLGELPWLVTVVVLVREVGVTALRFVVIRHGVIPASRGGKAKTGLQGIAIGLYLLPLPAALQTAAAAVMVAAVAVTLVTGVDYALRARRLWRSSAHAGSEASGRPPP